MESPNVRDQPESGLQARKIENEHGHACEQKPEKTLLHGSPHISRSRCIHQDFAQWSAIQAARIHQMH
jgi:hypothetical protein